jgi:DNA-directed RNA polymerase specialized sigma subunit
VEFVHQEYQREEQKRLTLIEPEHRPTEELEKEDWCLTQCLGNLPESERKLFELYFQGEKRVRINRRKQLAVELMLTANALRIRAYKLRKEMHQCLVTCLSQT